MDIIKDGTKYKRPDRMSLGFNLLIDLIDSSPNVFSDYPDIKDMMQKELFPDLVEVAENLRVCLCLSLVKLHEFVTVSLNIRDQSSIH